MSFKVTNKSPVAVTLQEKSDDRLVGNAYKRLAPKESFEVVELTLQMKALRKKKVLACDEIVPPAPLPEVLVAPAVVEESAPAPEVSLNCELCGETFTSEKKLAKHVKQSHE